MGASDFCNCKSISDGSCFNSITFQNLENLICPENTSTTYNKREFLSNSFNNNNNDITIDELIKKQAVNKIIKAFRTYKINKLEQIKYSNSYINENNISIQNINDIGNNENNEDYNNNNFLKNNNNINLKKIKTIKNNENSSDRFRNSCSSIRTIYKGGGNKDNKEGFGINSWSDEAKYIGYYKNNKAEGYGKFIAGNDIYQGEFKDDAANGYGIFKNTILTYEGFWVKDLQEIYGIEIWKDGSIYKGEYSEGKKNGIGVYSWSDGTKYEGMWKNNTFNGLGIFYFSDNKYYFGEWKNKKKEGFGEFIYKEKKFIGFYCNDKRNGLGILVWKNGQKAQIGFWKEGKQFGLGKFMNKKKVYFGIWQMNKKVKWLKNEKEWIEYIERNKMDKYKKIFGFDLVNIYDFCYNKDDIDKLLIEN